MGRHILIGTLSGIDYRQGNQRIDVEGDSCRGDNFVRNTHRADCYPGRRASRVSFHTPRQRAFIMILARLAITIAVALTIPLVARSLHARESPLHAIRVVIDNRPGANGAIGAELARLLRDDPAKWGKVIRDQIFKDER